MITLPWYVPVCVFAAPAFGLIALAFWLASLERPEHSCCWRMDRQHCCFQAEKPSREHLGRYGLLRYPKFKDSYR